MDRETLNRKRFRIGENIEISIIQLISLFVINISLISILINLFLKGSGGFEWWSAYVSGSLIFAYLILRIFTSSGVVLGRQVTLLITVFNLFLNLFKVFGIVKPNAYWELTILIPLVNLICMLFLIVVFIIRKKKFRTIIMPSLNVTLFSILPIVRLYIATSDNFVVPVFSSIVLIFAFALFINSLILNWLTIRKATELNFQQIKKGVNDFKKAGDKVANVNKKLEGLGNNIVKVKSFWTVNSSVVKEFFTFKKKKEEKPFEVLTEKQAAQIQTPIEILVPDEHIEDNGKSKNNLFKDILSLNILKKATSLFVKKDKKGKGELMVIEQQDEHLEKYIVSDVIIEEKKMDIKPDLVNSFGDNVETEKPKKPFLSFNFLKKKK